MSNSELFDTLLRQLSESEKSQPSVSINSISVKRTFSDNLIFQASEPMDVGTAYTQLAELFLSEGVDKRYLARFLNSLPKSEFSIMQLIGGCATAIQYEKIRPDIDLIHKASRDIRDSHLIQKNDKKGAVRAERRSDAALALNPTISNAMRFVVVDFSEAPVGLALNPTFSNAIAVKDSILEITLHRIGCASYPQDQLIKKQQPSTPALLAFHLEYLFRRWPVSEKTFPVYPPRKQPRGQQSPDPTGKPRRDVIARLLSRIFPPSDETYSVPRVKDFLRQMKEQGAVYVGW